MSEFSGSATTPVPVVIFDIQRIGTIPPSPHPDISCDVPPPPWVRLHAPSHGDTNHLVLLARHGGQCYEFARDAFDYPTVPDSGPRPSDLALGMKPVDTPASPTPTSRSTGKVLSRRTSIGCPATGAVNRDVEGTR